MPRSGCEITNVVGTIMIVKEINIVATLFDLSEQPDEIKEIIKETVANAKTKDVEQVGLKLIKFCAKWDLQRIAEYPQSYAEPLNGKYKKEEVICNKIVKIQVNQSLNGFAQ